MNAITDVLRLEAVCLIYTAQIQTKMEVMRGFFKLLFTLKALFRCELLKLILTDTCEHMLL